MPLWWCMVLCFWYAFLLAWISWIVLLKLYHTFPVITLFLVICLAMFSCSHSATVWNPVFLCGGQTGTLSQLDPGPGWDRCRAFLWIPQIRVLGLCWLQVHRHIVSRSAFHVWGNQPPAHLHVQISCPFCTSDVWMTLQLEGLILEKCQQPCMRCSVIVCYSGSISSQLQEKTVMKDVWQLKLISDCMNELK